MWHIELSELNPGDLACDIFIHRLFEWVFGSVTRGFLPDVYNILNKYKLQMCFHTYVHGGNLPTKICWKAIVDEAIDEHEQLCIIDNLQCKNDVDRYL